MLPPFIIEQIRQREERERLRQEQSRPRLELPVDDSPPHRGPRAGEEDDDEADRGVVIVDLLG
jgi:hypothetical protein